MSYRDNDGRCKYCGACWYDDHECTGTAYTDGYTTAHTELRRVYEEIAQLPRPWFIQDLSWHGDAFECAWCGVKWHVDKDKFPNRHDRDFPGFDAYTEHPVNDCLWSRALTATQTKEKTYGM